MKRKISLKRSIIVLLAGAYIIILALLVTLNGYLITTYQDVIRTKWDNTLREYSGTVSDELEAMNATAYDVCTYDENFGNLVSKSGISALEDVYKIRTRLQSVMNFYGKNNGYFLYYNNMENREYLFRQNKIKPAEFELLKERTKGTVLTETPFIQTVFTEVEGKSYALCARREGNVAICAVYYLSEAAEDIESLLEEYHVLAYYTYDGKPLPGAEKSGSSRSADGYEVQSEVGNLGLTLHLSIPRTIWLYMNVQQILLLAASLLFGVFGIIFYLRIRAELLKPMDAVRGELERISGGDMESRVKTTTRMLELQQMIDTVNRALDEVEKQKLISYEQTIEAQNSYMQFLTMQLKPHFYLNGLKTLNVLALNGDNERIRSMIFQLSEHLRYHLQAEKALVSLNSEIEYVENYKELQKNMTDRPIAIHWDIQENLKDWYVPTLCIQTFVENSFKYAKLGSVNNELIIDISVNELETEDGLFLDLCIRDNGSGYPEELLECLNGEAQADSSSIGINNLKRRCRIIYGGWDEYYFDNDGGAMSNLIFPFRTHLEEEKT